MVAGNRLELFFYAELQPTDRGVDAFLRFQPSSTPATGVTHRCLATRHVEGKRPSLPRFGNPNYAVPFALG
jgi:hypothetical protein